jgi:hypothetical protein
MKWRVVLNGGWLSGFLSVSISEEFSIGELLAKLQREGTRIFMRLAFGVVFFIIAESVALESYEYHGISLFLSGVRS